MSMGKIKLNSMRLHSSLSIKLDLMILDRDSPHGEQGKIPKGLGLVCGGS